MDSGLRDTERLILGRTAVVEGRMATLAIIKQLDVVKQGRPGLRSILKRVVPGPLILERAEKTLHRGIIVTLPFATHADSQAVGLQDGTIGAARILAPLVAVVD